MGNPNIPNNHVSSEIRSIRSLPELAIRTTNRSEKLFPAENAVLEKFLEVAESYQIEANEQRRPIYIRYVYGRGNPQNGSFEYFHIEREEGKQRSDIFVTPDTAKFGPCFCIYPQDTKEVFLEAEDGKKAAAGLRCNYGENTVWYPENLSNIAGSLYNNVHSEVVRDAPAGAILDDRAVNIFVTQLLRNGGDEEIRPFLCGYRNGQYTLVIPGISTVGKLRNLFTRVDKEGSAYFFLQALALSIASDLGPIDAMKKQLQAVGDALGITVSDGQVGTPILEEYLDRTNAKARQKVFASHEEEVIAEVTEALRKARVPKKSVIWGGLVELLYKADIEVQNLVSQMKEINVSIPEFAAILKAIGAYGLDFLGPTLLAPARMDSKLTPALEARLAGLPFPYVRSVVIRGGKVLDDEVINDGSLFIQSSPNGVFVKKSLTSMKKGIGFVADASPETFTPSRDGDWIVMPRLELDEAERRIWFHPILGIVMVDDRTIPADIRNSDKVIDGGRYQKREIIELSAEEADAVQAFLLAMDARAVDRVAGGTEWGLEYGDRMRKMYEDAEIIPTLGLFAYDLLWAKIGNEEDGAALNKENPLLQKGVPFVSEMQDSIQLANDDIAARMLMRRVKEKFAKRPWVVPTAYASSMHAVLLNVLAQNIETQVQSKSLQIDFGNLFVPINGVEGGVFVDAEHNRRRVREKLADFVQRGIALIENTLQN